MKILAMFFVNFIFLQIILCQEQVIKYEPTSFEIVTGKSKYLSISLNTNHDREVKLNFTYGDENNIFDETKIISPLSPIIFKSNDTGPVKVAINAENVGHLVIGAKSNDIKIPYDNVFRLSVIHSNFVNVLIDIIGWIYFVAWSFSFYPQVILNFRTKNVSGLSLDFIALNFLGFFCYSVYNACLFWNKNVQKEYFHHHPRGVLPVLLNDVLFSFHALTLTFVTGVQCIAYRKRGHRISLTATIILSIMFLFLIVSGIVCASSKFSSLDFIYFFSYVKLAITLMKYIPQAYLNFKRKSTIGWSIQNVILDFTGGSFSIFQMFFLAYNYNDWSSIFGSPTKFGLGFLSIVFDLIFLFQHYILYRKPSGSYESYEPIS